MGTLKPGGGVVLDSVFRCFREFYLSFWQSILVDSSLDQNINMVFLINPEIIIYVRINRVICFLMFLGSL